MTVPGIPQGKERPRTTRDGHVYTPTKTKRYERHVRQCCPEDLEQFPEGTPLRLVVEAKFPIPKSWSKKKKERMYSSPAMTKPDWDNIGKIISDALNQLAYADDKQITSALVQKRYCGSSEDPCVILSLKEDEGC